MKLWNAMTHEEDDATDVKPLPQDSCGSEGRPRHSIPYYTVPLKVIFDKSIVIIRATSILVHLKTTRSNPAITSPWDQVHQGLMIEHHVLIWAM
jgi:hypothetical protein